MIDKIGALCRPCRVVRLSGKRILARCLLLYRCPKYWPGGTFLTDYVKIEKGLGPEGRIAVVRFDRSDGINALSPEALRQLTQAARAFEDDNKTSVVVLTGSAKAFSAGFDLKDTEGRSRRTMDIGALRRHLKLGPRLSQAWQDMEQVTIAAIEGFCIGGGVALAVA